MTPIGIDLMLQDLEARWRDERTPQAGVRLAEALQKEGDEGRAQEVLSAVEMRLESEPRDLASRVAVGGLRLGMGQAADAARVLEEVVKADPTHLKANKLLVEVYLQLDQRDRARDRLDLYRLLNQGDPEIENLEGMVVGVTAETPAAPAPAASRRLRLGGGDPFGELAAEAPEPPVDDLFTELPPPSEPTVATATLGALYQEQGHRQEAERVFRDVIAQEPDNLRAREGLAALAEGAEETVESAAAPAGETAAQSAPDEALTDRERRVALLQGYLARIQRGREALAR